jgi:hypothetical protein
MWLTMFSVVIAVCIGVHLGLFEAICEVASKIAVCYKCACFWGCIADAITAVTLSIIAAYLSNWVGLLLVQLNKLYDVLWERLNERTQARAQRK